MHFKEFLEEKDYSYLKLLRESFEAHKFINEAETKTLSQQERDKMKKAYNITDELIDLMEKRSAEKDPEKAKELDEKINDYKKSNKGFISKINNPKFKKGFFSFLKKAGSIAASVLMFKYIRKGINALLPT